MRPTPGDGEAMNKSDIENMISGIRKEDAREVAYALLAYAESGIVPDPSICIECGVEFYGSKQGQSYCSHRCAHRVGSRKRYAAYFKKFEG